MTRPTDTPSLRRVPQQARSRERVRRVLDTADRLLATEGAAALTTSRLAQEAGISVGSLYQWFGDLEAVLGGLVQRYTSEFEELARTFADVALEAPPADPAGAALVMFADAFRARPGFRALWFGGLRTEELRDVARGALRPIGDALASVLARQYPHAAPQLVASVTEMFVLVGDALLRQAFRRDAGGDQALLDEAALMLRTYVEARLTAPAKESR
jgi:AcrR family transcriptional regulator